ncbi:MAG: 3-phosphoserine/phosphohydroxythreonine transaminase [Fimbriimonadales bacterium]|nr:3-phosphoserine/phosphohydroxythreonine transaminase [Fimbriimonadales bacterium]
MLETQDKHGLGLPYGRIYNFSAGPGALPVEVLEEAKDDLLNYKGTGMSVMEMSHRGKTYDDIHMTALANLRKLLGAPDDWGVLMLQGGASLQNAMVPMNLKMEGKRPNYIDTGHWGHLSLGDAKLMTDVHVAYSSEGTGFDRAPSDDEPQFTPDVSYVYYTSNETVGGVDYLRDATFNTDALVVCDASSNILSRKFDLTKYDVIFAGAQKTQGPAGVTTVILSPRALEVAAQQKLPLMLSWTKAHKAHSIHNTPPCFAIYMCGLYYQWLLKNGGVDWIAPINERKAAKVYEVIDEGFYKGHAVKENRSRMNITFKCPTEELDKKFADEAEANGFSTLAGHRSVGGIRVSMYNAFPESGADAIAQFMREFARKNG